MYQREGVQERRKFGRRTVLKQAVIVTETGERLKCCVVDMSEGGARLRFAGGALPEGEFALEIPEDDFIVRCQRVHCQPDNTAGVRYTRSPARISWGQRTTRNTPVLSVIRKQED